MREIDLLLSKTTSELPDQAEDSPDQLVFQEPVTLDKCLSKSPMTF